MWEWYAKSAICYAFLNDVPGHLLDLERTDSDGLAEFAKSKWFDRGWTLQELIAPQRVVFFGQSWNELGERGEALLETISTRTGIDSEVLRKVSEPHNLRLRYLSSTSVAKRLSWAARRVTTRKEDEAYCLLGLLDVNMPLLYGEGSRAFLRLQHEVIRMTRDHSIFAWESEISAFHGFYAGLWCLLAPAPTFFAGCADVIEYPFGAMTAYEVTNLGLRITLPVLPSTNGSEQYGILCCQRVGKPGTVIGLCLGTSYDSPTNSVMAVSNDKTTGHRTANIPEGEAAASPVRALVIQTRTEPLGQSLTTFNKHFWLRYHSRLKCIANLIRKTDGRIGGLRKPQHQTHPHCFLRMDYPHQLKGDVEIAIWFSDDASDKHIALVFSKTTLGHGYPAAEYIQLTWKAVPASKQFREPPKYFHGAEECVQIQRHRFNSRDFGAEGSSQTAGSIRVDERTEVSMKLSREFILGMLCDVWTLDLIEGTVSPTEVVACEDVDTGPPPSS
jgi:hypothetical protein